MFNKLFPPTRTYRMYEKDINKYPLLIKPRLFYSRYSRRRKKKIDVSQPWSNYISLGFLFFFISPFLFIFLLLFLSLLILSLLLLLADPPLPPLLPFSFYDSRTMSQGKRKGTQASWLNYLHKGRLINANLSYASQSMWFRASFSSK